MEVGSENINLSEGDEYAELKYALTGYGLFEDDMQLIEMRQILEALKSSENDFIKAAGHQENRKFDEDVFNNSTMMYNGVRQTAAPGDSPLSFEDEPGPHFEVLTVTATVHHPLNWDPPPPSDSSDHLTDNNKQDMGTKTLPPIRKRFADEEETNAATSSSTKRLKFDESIDSIEDAPDPADNFSYVPATPPYLEDNWDDYDYFDNDCIFSSLDVVTSEIVEDASEETSINAAASSSSSSFNQNEND